MLKLSGVSKVHQTGDVQTTALDHIDLDISAGEYVAIHSPAHAAQAA